MKNILLYEMQGLLTRLKTYEVFLSKILFEFHKKIFQHFFDLYSNLRTQSSNFSFLKNSGP
jgi:hypothetical protein